MQESGPSTTTAPPARAGFKKDKRANQLATSNATICSGGEIEEFQADMMNEMKKAKSGKSV